MFRRSSVFVLCTLLLLNACQKVSPPPQAQPTLTLSPLNLNSLAGDAPTTFTATVQNSTDTVSWSLSGPGFLSSTTGSSTRYTPPATLTESLTATLTARLAART